MNWQAKTFATLSVAELHAIYRLRVATFVVEQQCPYQEVDDRDPTATHLYATENDAIAAYCRLIQGAEGVHIGRVIVAPARRGRGMAKTLMQAALCLVAGQAAYLQAQAHLQNFYASFGFLPISDVYPEDGIAHIDMRRPPDA